MTVSEGRMGADTSGLAARAFLSRIEGAGGSLLSAAVRRVQDSGAVIVNDGVEKLVSCDAIVVADPVRSAIPEWLDLLEIPDKIIGDARDPRGIGPAIAEGRDVMRSVG